ncbi:MAG: Asp-tRNA(Asn)/Glu-tRNA(Gln) amidotransferase subunit GatC [Proteobacteria bacterium]|jgi:aspartyl-tRNA(Asn)/glutamyl-tRNA(Gln) amidotransferase subunit C|nr:Asp-tRNA(Asn)/Glu-tRNA(Gln) amidotransferase subunit GatC [Pseudomonadota bacterium]
MAINNNDVQKIAQLARLELNDEQATKFSSELASILQLVEQMKTCDTESIAPMTHPFDAALRLREDAVTEKNLRDKFQSIAPATQDGLYLVPKVID